MEFDANRKGTGTAEWAEEKVNICRGCANDCLYCYAAANALRFKWRERDDWHREELTQWANAKSYPLKKGVVMFPTSHDITPFNLEASVRILKLILAKGNKVLIVTKPQHSCIMRLLIELEPWIDQILFRFTIGTTENTTSRFWESGASLPAERIGCLKMAWNTGFATSVSIEPKLLGVEGTISVVEAVLDYVTDTIWIGKMNRALLRVDKSHRNAVDFTMHLQRDSEIMRLVHRLETSTMVRWKDSIKEVIARQTETA